MTEIDPVVVERRVLIKYILEEKRRQGVDVVLPVGCNDFDNWLLDALDVDKLVNSLDHGKRVDLTDICDPENARPIARRTSVNSTRATEDGGYAGDLLNPNDIGMPRLGISYLSSQMSDQGLRDIAFEIFDSCCGKSASLGLAQSMRGQLEIGEKRANDLQRLIAKAKMKKSLMDVESHIRMLEVATPADFQNYRSYMTWRDATSMLIQLSLIHSAQTSWASKDDASAHYLISVMKGAFRRLDARDADDYDGKEKSDAVHVIATVCGDIASRCSNGYDIPWDLKASIAEVLLRGSFDSLDEGCVIDEADELDGLLRRDIWPRLGISNEVHVALQIWAHYRQFYISKEISILERAIDMASTVNPSNGKADGSNKLVQEIMTGVWSECIRVLSDYHHLCSSPREVSAMIRLLVTVDKISEREENLVDTLSNLIKASVTESFERKAEEVRQHAPSEQDQVALLATESLELLRAECEEYSAMLRHYIPSSTGIAAAALHECYGARLLPWVVSTTSLDKHVIATLSTSMSLEDQLMMEMLTFGLDAPEWGVLDRITPQLYDWTKGQLQTLQEWCNRIISSESWKVTSHARNACGSSVGEILKASTDVVESLFMLGIPIPPGVVRCMVDGVDSILQRYCDAVVTQLGSADQIIPPKPPLTRYKKDVVDQAQQTDRSGDIQSPGNTQKSPSSLKNITAKVGSVFTSSWLPNLTAEQKQNILGVSFDSLALRANSLSNVAQGMGKMNNIVVEKWESGQPRSSSAKGHKVSMEWASGMFTGVMAKAASDVDRVLHFVAIKLICGHLRDQVFSQLYRFDVQAHRIHGILREIDTSLGDMCEILHPSLTSRLAGHFCKALNEAITHVLLDGGPVRWFSAGDVPILKQDMEAMASMFYADGDGLEQDQVEKLMSSSMETIQLMERDTASLISMIRDTKRNSSHASVDSDTLVRILCHRKDHAASKYLKKEYKFPKKLPNILTASISRNATPPKR